MAGPAVLDQVRLAPERATWIRTLLAGEWRFWRGPGSSGSNVEIVRWGRAGETALLTQQATAVLAAAGRSIAAPVG